MDTWPANDVVAAFNAGHRGSGKASTFFSRLYRTLSKLKNHTLCRPLHVRLARDLFRCLRAKNSFKLGKSLERVIIFRERVSGFGSSDTFYNY